MDRFYAMLDGAPVIFVKNTAGDITGAFWYVNGGWSPIDSSEVSREAALMSKAEFDEHYSSLPQLPNTAFQAGLE